jgi:hypothetical protein
MSIDKLKNILGIIKFMDRLNLVKYDENIAIVSKDNRRNVSDPEKILTGLDGNWHWHNIITIKSRDSLGNHYHDYREMFYTPTGGIKFALTDIEGKEDPKIYTLAPDSRIVLPPYTVHAIVSEPGSVWLCYGDAVFDVKKLMAADKNIVSKLERMLKQ